jgi:hypothetical protein
MKKISKTNTIINAFTGSIPYGEQWFEERKAICDGCEYNSKNRKSETLAEKAQDLLHGGEPYCRACLCFIDRKAAMKEETCGLKEKGLVPKWNALMVHTTSSKDYNLYNNTPKVCTIDLSDDEERYEVNYGDLTEKSDTKIQLVLEGECPITDVTVGCGCTLASWAKIGDNLYELNTSLKMSMINKGNFRKNIYVKYKVEDEERKATIALKGIKR